MKWRDINRVIFVGAAAGAVWFLHGSAAHGFLDPYIDAIGVACTLIGGFPIFHEAFENVMERRMTMELSMVIAILAALAIREIFTALVITEFVLAAEILEGLTVGRGRKAIQALVDLMPQSAVVRRGSDWKEIAVDQLRQRDEVLARPGTRIPVDGQVVGGHSFVDEASITGEPMAAEKVPGAIVFAGTINQSGALEIRVDKVGRDTSFGKIIEAVERARNSQAPIQRLADRLAGYLVYFALGAAVITFLITHNIRSTISVVIVAGACGIAAGTPLAVLGAIGRAAQSGAIVKGGRHLENLAEIDTVLLDKTGTVTLGTPEVSEVQPATSVLASALIESAAMAEGPSEHPIAKAIVREAARMGVSVGLPERFDYIPGRGVTAIAGGDEIAVGNWVHVAGEVPEADSRNGKRETAVYVTRAGVFQGTIYVADVLRPEAAAAIQELKSMKLRTVLLTGDSKTAAEEVGVALGVDEIFAELLPEEKLRYVQKLISAGSKVVMVGDGINDAPALTEATVGVAMGSGTDVARESADVVLIGSDLIKFVQTVRIARHCHAIIMENFVGTLAVDTVGIVLAAFGFLNPVLAALIHVSSEMVFILNSARLLPRRRVGGAAGRRVKVSVNVPRTFPG